MPDKVTYLPGNKGAADPPGGGDGVDNERLTRLETKIETILPTLATKADVEGVKSGLVMWLSGIILAASALIVGILLFAINRISPPQPTQQQAPVVVYPQQPANPPAPQSPPATKPGR